MEEALISLKEAAERRIERVRLPRWAIPMDHVKLTFARDNGLGIWVQLYSPFNKECNGRDPVSMLVLELGDREAKAWLPYTGALPDSPEYLNEQAAYDRCITSRG